MTKHEAKTVDIQFEQLEETLLVEAGEDIFTITINGKVFKLIDLDNVTDGDIRKLFGIFSGVFEAVLK